jgi:hypothetical protein
VFVKVTRFELLVELRRSSKCVAVLTISCVKAESKGAMVVPMRGFKLQYFHFPLLFTRFLCGARGDKKNEADLASFTTGKNLKDVDSLVPHPKRTEGTELDIY